jgi:hypothetical protein
MSSLVQAHPVDQRAPGDSEWCRMSAQTGRLAQLTRFPVPRHAVQEAAAEGTSSTYLLAYFLCLDWRT